MSETLWLMLGIWLFAAACWTGGYIVGRNVGRRTATEDTTHE